MKFTELEIPDVVLIEPEVHGDERGFALCPQQSFDHKVHGTLVRSRADRQWNIIGDRLIHETRHARPQRQLTVCNRLHEQVRLEPVQIFD